MEDTEGVVKQEGGNIRIVLRDWTEIWGLMDGEFGCKVLFDTCKCVL